jgi:formylglycine-generating enzyme required for sulfatase activity
LALIDPIARVLRGGSWNNNPQNLRSANRNRNQPDNRNNNIGFRLASTIMRGCDSGQPKRKE